MPFTTLSDRRQALAALTAAGVLFGLTVPLSKLALGWLSPAWLAAARFGLAAPILAWVVSRAELRAACSPRVVFWGALGYGGTITVQNVGVAQTSVTHAALIFGAVPALVLAVAGLRAFVAGRTGTVPVRPPASAGGEADTGRGSGSLGAGPAAWAGAAVALVGVGLVAAAPGGHASLVGDGLVLASALLNALAVVAQADVLRGRNAIAVTAVQMTAAAGLSLFVALIFEPLPHAAAGAGPVWSLAGLVLLGSLLPFTLYAFGQARVSPEVAGAFINLEPLVGAAVGVLVFGNAFGFAQAIGALAIVIGLVLGLTPSSARDHTGPRTDRLRVILSGWRLRRS